MNYALCNDRRTLLWFANQRAVEYHPTLVAGEPAGPHDPPRARPRSAGGRRLRAGRPSGARWFVSALTDAGLEGAVKTSGAKGMHVFVPIDDQAPLEDAAAATRAIAARAEQLDPDIATTAFIKEDRGGKVFLDSTRPAARPSWPRTARASGPGVPVSFPVTWDELDRRAPADFTVHTALRPLGDGDPWADQMPTPQPLPAELVAEGHAIPVARVQAMHEGKRRARARRSGQGG